MGLKINGVGQTLTNYTYSTGITNQNTLFITIKYQRLCYGLLVEKIRIYEIRADIRHPSLSLIKQTVDGVLQSATGQKVFITEDKVRTYVTLHSPNQSYQYTGLSLL